MDDTTIVVNLTGEDQEPFCCHVLARNHMLGDLFAHAKLGMIISVHAFADAAAFGSHGETLRDLLQSARG